MCFGFWMKKDLSYSINIFKENSLEYSLPWSFLVQIYIGMNGRGSCPLINGPRIQECDRNRKFQSHFKRKVTTPGQSIALNFQKYYLLRNKMISYYFIVKTTINIILLKILLFHQRLSWLILLSIDIFFWMKLIALIY